VTVPAAKTRAKETLAPAELAYQRIREDIVEGRYMLGAVLSSRRIAADLGMSFLPVLRALQRLESDGLVESRERVGTRVVLPTEDDVRGLMAIREALECQAARLCCEFATRAQRDQLMQLARRVDAAYAGSEKVGRGVSARRRANLLHTQLHLNIAQSAHCPKLLQEIERSQVLTFKAQLDHSAMRRIRPDHWHESLLTVVTGDDPDAADLAMRRHIRFGVPDVLETIRSLEIESRWRHS
jgi:DNA-binding GntR family transcriptional regulator